MTSKSASSGIVAGIDVGGTFTDLVLFESRASTVRLAKVPTTLEDQSVGVVGARQRFAITIDC